MSEYQISSLQSVANKILDAFHIHTSKVIDALEHLRAIPDLIRGLGNIINDGFDRQIRASGEAVILGKVASVSSKRSLVESENLAIEEFKKQLHEDSTDIQERYGKIQQDLNEDAKNRVRELDEHLLGLYDEHFLVPPRGVFGQATEAMLHVFLQDSVSHFGNRTGAVGRALEAARQEAVSFIGSRSRFFSTLRRYTQLRGTDALATHQMPVLVLVTSDEGYGRSTRLEVPLAGAASRSAEVDQLLTGEPGSTMLNRVTWSASDDYKELIKKRIATHAEQGRIEQWMVKPLHRIIDDSPVETILEGQS